MAHYKQDRQVFIKRSTENGYR